MALRVRFEDVENKGTDSGGDVIYYYRGEPLNGIIEEFKDGILIGELEFKDGHRGGIQRIFYDSGQIEEEYTILYNKLEGSFRSWDEDGTLTSETFWSNGIQIG